VVVVVVAEVVVVVVVPGGIFFAPDAEAMSGATTTIAVSRPRSARVMVVPCPPARDRDRLTRRDEVPVP
jgi:hypothetical protein